MQAMTVLCSICNCAVCARLCGRVCDRSTATACVQSEHRIAETLQSGKHAHKASLPKRTSTTQSTVKRTRAAELKATLQQDTQKSQNTLSAMNAACV